MTINFYLPIEDEYEEYNEEIDEKKYDEDDLVDILNDYRHETDPPSVRSASLMTIRNPPRLH